MTEHTEGPDPELDALIQAILDDPAYANGIRASDRGLSAEEALAILEEFYDVHDAGDERMPLVADNLGRTIACKLGCHACCGSLILVSTPEARLIARELRKPENRAMLEHFQKRASSWVLAAGDGPSRAAEANAAGNTNRYQRLQVEHGRKRILCPLSSAGACDVYSVRPLPCRQVWVVDTPDYCMPGDDPDQPDAQLISYPGFDALVHQGRRLTAGMQHVMGDGVRREPLVLALLKVLDEE